MLGPREGSTISLDDSVLFHTDISELFVRLSAFSHFPAQNTPTREEPNTLLRAPNECALLCRHFQANTSALLPGPRPTNPFTPNANTKRSIRSTENQITPPFIFTLVFHLLPESYPSFPLLSPDGQTEAPPPPSPHKKNKTLDPQQSRHRCLHKCGRNQTLASDLAQVDVTVHDHRAQKGELAKWSPDDLHHNQN